MNSCITDKSVSYHRVGCDSVLGCSDTHGSTSTHRHTRMHTEECVWTCICSHPNAFYQSNLTGRSMIWLANRELMQSRGVLPSLSPSCLNLHLSISLMSLSSSSTSLLAFPTSCFFTVGNNKTTAALSHWWNTSGRPMGSVAIFAGFLVNIFWSLVILFKRGEGTNRDWRTCKHSSDRSEHTAVQKNTRTGVWSFAFVGSLLDQAEEVCTKSACSFKKAPESPESRGGRMENIQEVESTEG